MALTISTDLVNITLAEALMTSYGAGGTGAIALEPDFFAQGLNCNSRGASAAGIKGGTYDIGAGAVLNFSAAGAAYGKLIYIWLRHTAPGLIGLKSAGGIRIILGSGATAPGDAAGVWSAWYVDGSDTLAVTDGWKCYALDPSLAASTTFGGGVDLTAVRWFGAAANYTAGAKGQTFGIDAIRYGLGELRCLGTNATAGAGFKEMSDGDFGDVSKRYGIMVEKEGVFLVKGNLVIGDAVTTSATDFSSQNETLIWEHQTYYDGTRLMPMVRNKNLNTGLPYFGLTFRGNATAPAGNTVVTFGVKVGTGDAASGRSGSSFTGSRTKTKISCDDGQVEGVGIYGCSFARIRGGIDMSANAATDEFIGNVLSRCGTFLAGPVQVRACSFIDCNGGAYYFMEDFYSPAAAAAALTTADPSIDWLLVLNGSNLSVPSKVTYVELLAPAGSDRREVVQLNGDQVGSNDHYAEGVVRWPGAGTNRGALGVTIRGAAATTEDYWYLKADLQNSLLSLICCTGGSDATIASVAKTFAVDTDYLLQLSGVGTLIEGFCNGTKLAATSATFQTNRRTGIRGDGTTAQTGTAPRMSRFGTGPTTDKFGAITLPTLANDNVKYCLFINNARAVAITDDADHSFTEHDLSGNLVDIRNQSGATIIVDVYGGSFPASPAIENTGGSGAASTRKPVTLEVNGVVEGVRCFIETLTGGPLSEGVVLMLEDANASGIAQETFYYTANQPVRIRARLLEYLPFETTGVITAGGLAITAIWLADPNVQ